MDILNNQTSFRVDDGVGANRFIDLDEFAPALSVVAAALLQHVVLGCFAVVLDFQLVDARVDRERELAGVTLSPVGEDNEEVVAGLEEGREVEVVLAVFTLDPAVAFVLFHQQDRSEPEGLMGLEAA